MVATPSPFSPPPQWWQYVSLSSQDILKHIQGMQLVDIATN